LLLRPLSALLWLAVALGVRVLKVRAAVLGAS
jgi:hypothetical protein